jgi:hypothetical protein
MYHIYSLPEQSLPSPVLCSMVLYNSLVCVQRYTEIRLEHGWGRCIEYNVSSTTSFGTFFLDKINQNTLEMHIIFQVRWLLEFPNLNES